MIAGFLFGETDEYSTVLIVGLLQFLSFALLAPVVETLEIAICLRDFICNKESVLIEGILV